MTTTESDAREGNTSGNGNGNAPETPLEGDPTRRRDARTYPREGQLNTDSDEGEPEAEPREWPTWAVAVRNWVVNAPLWWQPPTPLNDLWARVQGIVKNQDGWLPRNGIRAVGGVGYIVSAVLYAVAYLAAHLLLPGGGPLESLGDLWERVDNLAYKRDGASRRAIHILGGTAWTITAGCYGVAYAAQWPLLVLLLGCFGLAAFISSLV